MSAAETLIDLDIAKARDIVALANAYRDALPPGTTPEAVAADVAVGQRTELRLLTGAIAALSRAERAELVALVWMGQGEYDDFSASRTFAIATADSGIPEYLAKKALTLPELLTAPLKKMGYAV